MPPEVASCAINTVTRRTMESIKTWAFMSLSPQPDRLAPVRLDDRMVTHTSRLRTQIFSQEDRKIGRASKDFFGFAACGAWRILCRRRPARCGSNPQILGFRSSDLPVKKSGDSR